MKNVNEMYDGIFKVWADTEGAELTTEGAELRMDILVIL